MSIHGSSEGKPKLALAFFTSGWFRDVGLQNESSDVTALVNETAIQLRNRLAEVVDPVFSGVLYSESEAIAAAKQVRESDVDAVLLSPLMWCEDQIVRAFLKETDCSSVILWTFSPFPALPEFVEFQTMLRGSGPVGSLQLSGMLKREGYTVHAVAGSGDDTDVYREIALITESYAVSRWLRSVRVGVLPFPCAQMSTTYVDEFELRNRYGVELSYLELGRVRSIAQGVDEDQLRSFRDTMPQDMEILVDERNLNQGIRYALALEEVTKNDGLSVIAMNDVIDEMHQSFGLRPCLANPRIAESGTVISMEADIAAGVAMSILRKFTDVAPFYVETFNVDYRDNALLLGHAGYHDPALADRDLPVRVIPDVEYENSDPFTGCATYFKYQRGPVTVINSVWSNGGLKWVGFRGESIGSDYKMEGNCHVYCRLEPDVKQFFRESIESGVSQHWVVLPGHMLAEIGVLCGILDIGWQTIE